MRRWIPAVVILVGLGAAEGEAPSPSPRPAVPPPLASTATTSATLPDSPRIDLVANEPRWHVTDRGLVLTIGGEGLHKYDLAYRSPWGNTATVGGRPARSARGKATLTFPWIDGDGAAEAVLRARGPGKVTLALDGKKLGSATLGDGWSEATVAVPAGRLTPGEHTLTIDGKRVPWDRIELVPADRAALAPCLPGEGWRRISVYTELPAAAFLDLKAAGGPAGPMTVTVTHQDGTVSKLPRPSGPLPANGEEVVRLDVETERCARWDSAEIVSRISPAGRRPATVDNVVLVVVDTLRADRLAAYGDSKVATPWMTAAAARGAVFLRNQSMAPSSPPSHATIHTGQIPRVHGATGDDGEIAPDAPIISAIAARAGLYTAFVGNNDFAMTRLRDPGDWDVFETPYYRHGKDCAPMFERGVALATAAAADRKRFFLSLLPIEPHVAYRWHAGITDKYFAGPWARPFGKKVTSAHLGRIKKMKMTDAQWAQVRALYDGEVEHVDRCLAALEDGLRVAGVLDRTAIIVASDHGEGLGERGTNVGHAYGLQRELVATPLIIAGGVAAARVWSPTSNADIAPTVLDLLGLPADPRMQGRSLVRDTLAPPLPRVVASEYGKSYALRAARWHLVVDYDGDAELFDAVADPDERDDRARDPAAAIPLRYLRDAAGLYLAHRADWKAATWGALNDLAPGNPLTTGAPDRGR